MRHAAHRGPRAVVRVPRQVVVQEASQTPAGLGLSALDPSLHRRRAVRRHRANQARVVDVRPGRVPRGRRAGGGFVPAVRQRHLGDGVQEALHVPFELAAQRARADLRLGRRHRHRHHDLAFDLQHRGARRVGGGVAPGAVLAQVAAVHHYRGRARLQRRQRLVGRRRQRQQRHAARRQRAPRLAHPVEREGRAARRPLGRTRVRRPDHQQRHAESVGAIRRHLERDVAMRALGALHQVEDVGPLGGRPPVAVDDALGLRRSEPGKGARKHEVGHRRRP